MNVLRLLWATIVGIVFPTLLAAQSLTFTEGYVGGYIGTTTNVLSTPISFSDAGIASITFAQNTSTGLYENTQGNDVVGTVTLTSTTGATISFGGAANWRYTTGATLNGIGIVPVTGANTTFNFNGTVLSPTNLMVIVPPSTYDNISITTDRLGVQEITGNAASVRADLNDILLAGWQPEMTVTKTVALTTDANSIGFAEVDDVLTYTVTVRNSGNVDILGLAVEDSVNGAAGVTLSPADPPLDASGTLAVGSTVTFTYPYLITQPDVDLGQISNIAVASGYPKIDAGGNPGTAADTFDVQSSTIGNTDATGSPTLFTAFAPVVDEGAMELVKTGVFVDANNDGVVSEGDRIDWTFRIYNISTVPLFGAEISDPLLELSGPYTELTDGVDVPVGLAPVEIGPIAMVLDGSIPEYADALATGRIENEATVTACTGDFSVAECVAESETLVEDDSADSRNAPAAAPTVVEFGAAVRVTKVADVQDLGTAAVGDSVTFTVTVENIGDLDVEVDRIDDPLASTLEAASGSPDPVNGGTLSVGDRWEYRATVILQQADIDRKFVENIASAVYSLPGSTGPENLVRVFSSANGNTIPEPENTTDSEFGEPTVAALSLIDEIDEQLIDILEADLRQTIQTQSRSFSRMAANALDTLKAGEQEDQTCGTQGNEVLDATASMDGGTLTADGTLYRESYDCVLKERRIISGEASVSTLEGIGEQVSANFAVQTERFVGPDKVRGRFWGGYVNSTTIDNSVQGKIKGAGLNAGIYGASRVGDGIYIDHYLAGAVGFHKFDLTFNPVAPINATGDYSYLAAFGGVGVSTEMRLNDTLIAPRLAVDLAYAAAGDVSVAASQFAGTPNERNEVGKLSLSDFEGARILGEIQLSDVNNPSDGELPGSASYEFTPRMFCDYGFQAAQETECGAGLSFEAETVASADLSYGVLIDFERTRSYERMTFGVNRTAYFDGNNGTFVSSMGVDQEGGGVLSQVLNWRF